MDVLGILALIVASTVAAGVTGFEFGARHGERIGYRQAQLDRMTPFHRHEYVDGVCTSCGWIQKALAEAE